MLWSTRTDAQHNGSLNTFLNLTHVDAMHAEPDYSPAAMQKIYDRYAKVANSINAKRTQNLTDSTVVMVLPESFSDPNRVPGVHFDKDPMPNIRNLDSTTTSGLMLSPGYGGGTANIEFRQLTGLSMANYNASLLTPYQQLLPQCSQFYSFNTIWNAACGEAYSTSCSIGYHPYHQSFYMRQANYKKMGFSHFYALDSNPTIPHGKQYIGANGEQGYVSDSDAYQNVIDSIRANAKEHKPSRYIQLITMQNHAPYTDLYGPTNEFRQTNASAHMPDEERDSIANYAKGMQRTDIATSDFLSALDSIDHPVTVVFYGDHLPGIYTTASQNDENLLALHETNYFIWSNKASFSNDRKLSQSNAAFSSSNYFMAQAAKLMGAKVSPYLALLQELHQEIPAISRSVAYTGATDGEDNTIFLDDKGAKIDARSLSSHAQQ
ncbi:MAG TPA: LTA synthase family protein, partial [Bifidobacterium animalis]|nr:LTA synthase family protein [Bifidobacterium animalis]